MTIGERQMERILSSRNISNPGLHMAVGFNRISTEILFRSSSRRQFVGQIVNDRIVVFLENSATTARIIWSSSLIPIRVKWESVARLNIRTSKIKLLLITFLYCLFVVLLKQCFESIFQCDAVTNEGQQIKLSFSNKLVSNNFSDEPRQVCSYDIRSFNLCHQ